MKPRDLAELTLLAAIWGGSFLCMRIAAAPFGPLPLAALRMAGAGLFLLPLLAWRREFGALRRHAAPIAWLGLTNSALPFVCFGYAALTLGGGLLSIFNASSPLFGALFARLWLGERLGPWRATGLAIGFAGVVLLAWPHAHFGPGGGGPAVLACMLAALSYGYSACAARRYLAGAPPAATAVGSQLAGALALAGPAALHAPAVPPPARAWAATIVLALVCTGIAYVLYYRLIARIGPTRAIAVTFLVPAFALAWGGAILGEPVTVPMLAGCAVILLGTALATGTVGPRRR